MRKVREYLIQLKLFSSLESQFCLQIGFKSFAIFWLFAILVYIQLLPLIQFYYGPLVHIINGNSSSIISNNPVVLINQIDDLIIKSIFWVFFLSLFIFLKGIYLGHLMLRPFAKVVSNLREIVLGLNTVSNQGGKFNDLKLMTDFSQTFFFWLANDYKAATTGDKKPEIAKFYNDIRGPSFDWTFFLHLIFLFLPILLTATLGIYFISDHLQRSLMELINTSKTGNSLLMSFFNFQEQLMGMIFIILLVLILVIYIYFILSLHDKVAAANFGFFATMRSFMKGDVNAKVRLIGHPHIKNYAREFNLLLDQLVKQKLPLKKNKGNMGSI